MSLTEYQEYEWLPDQLKNTGHPTYNGAGDILKRLDKVNWPPEEWKDRMGEDRIPFHWSPNQLELDSTVLLKMHKVVILKELGAREGLFVKIDLFEWFWKDTIADYVEALPAHPIEQHLPNSFRRFEVCPEKEMKPIRPEMASFRSPNWPKEMAELWDSPEFKNESDRILHEVSFGPSAEMQYLYRQSKHPMLSYRRGSDYHGVEGTGMPLEIEKRINESLALQLRLKLWWGWPDAPFACLSKLIHSHLEFLVQEGYLRSGRKPEEFALSEDGRKRLEQHFEQQVKLIQYLKKIDIPQLAVSAIIALADRIWPTR